MFTELLLPLAGGMLIGLGASILLVVNGRIAGISGMISALFARVHEDLGFRVAFLSALFLVGVGAAWLTPEAIGASPRGLATLAISGLLVGVGTRLANGCTSGHGVCGVSRLSAASAAATVTFIGTGVATVTLTRILSGAP